MDPICYAAYAFCFNFQVLASRFYMKAFLKSQIPAIDSSHILPMS